MAVTVKERWAGRRHTLGFSNSVEIPYVILGTDDDAEAHAAMLSEASPLYGGFPVVGSFVDQVADQIFAGAVQYGDTQQRKTVGDSTYHFTTAGGTAHITQSLETLNRYSWSARLAPDFGGAIGVTDDGVEGTDVVLPVYEWGEEHILPSDSVTNAYRLGVANLTACTNNAIFRGMAIGTVLFKGAEGSKRGADDWSIRFNFAFSPNRSGLTAGAITGIEKGGWAYLWLRYGAVADADSYRLVRQPIAAYTERVYESGDFSALGIGTGIP